MAVFLCVNKIRDVTTIEIPIVSIYSGVVIKKVEKSLNREVSLRQVFQCWRFWNV